RAHSEVRNGDTFGVLKLTLVAGRYAWEFIPTAGLTFRDSGGGVCHGRPSCSPGQPGADSGRVLGAPPSDEARIKAVPVLAPSARRAATTTLTTTAGTRATPTRTNASRSTVPAHSAGSTWSPAPKPAGGRCHFR